MSSESGKEIGLSITFKLLKPELAFPGTVVTGVPPQKLYTTQKWISTTKVQHALDTGINPDDVYPTEGFIHEYHGKQRLVLGDGNTKAIIAWIRESNVQFTILGKLPQGTKYISLRELRNRYDDLFRGFE